jgi:hypothetical protein
VGQALIEPEKFLDLFHVIGGTLSLCTQQYIYNFILTAGFMNLGAHFLWIGDRTRQIDGAHIEYFRGIANPVGLKVGPSITVDELVELVKVLNPNAEPGMFNAESIISFYGNLINQSFCRKIDVDYSLWLRKSRQVLARTHSRREKDRHSRDLDMRSVSRQY